MSPTKREIRNRKAGTKNHDRVVTDGNQGNQVLMGIERDFRFLVFAIGETERSLLSV